MKVKFREQNYDCLRVISAFAVVLMHVNWQFFKQSNGEIHRVSAVVESIINIVTRFSVPCFFMMSGAFILNGYKKYDNALAFYNRAVKKKFLPFGCFLIAYVVLDCIMDRNINVSNIMDVLRGDKYNLWFMYTLLFIYFLVPMLSIIKEHISDKAWIRASCIGMAWAIVSQSFSMHYLAYDIGVTVAYMFYFMLGNALYNHRDLFKSKKFILVLAGFTATAAAFFIRNNGFDRYVSDPYISFFSPSIVVLSVCAYTFAGGYRFVVNGKD